MERRWQVLLVTAVAVFMSFLDVTIVNIAFPDIERSFPGASRAGLSWVLNGYNIVFAALLVPSGRIADRIGRKRVFFIGLSTFVVASALSAAAPSAEALIAARLIQAVGAALLVPASLSLLLPEFPPAQRATATAIWGATGAVAAATGPSLGGVLVQSTDWRLVFLVNVPIGLAALIPARRLLTEARDPNAAARPDLASVVLLGLGVGLVALGIVEGPDWGWGGARVLSALIGGAVVLAALIIRSGRVSSPVLDPALFKIRSFSVASAAIVLYGAAFYALLLCNVLFLTTVWHYSTLKAGFALTPSPIMATLASPIGGRLSDRFGQRVVAIPGLILFGGGVLMYSALLDASPDYVTAYLPAAIVAGLGVGFTFAALGSAAVAQLPPNRFATGSAVSACARQIGAVLGISTLVAVLGTPSPADALDHFRDAWHLMALASAASLACAVALGRVRVVSAADALAGAPRGVDL